MSGSTYGALIILALFVLVMYREHAKNAAVAIGQAAGSGLQGISGRKWILWVLLGIPALLVLKWLYQSKPTITGMAEWVRANLLFTLVATAIVTLIIDKYLPKMWWVPAAIVAGLLVTHWANNPSPKKATTSTHCQDASRFETRECTLGAKASTQIKFGDGPSDNGMHLCISGGVQFERTQQGGTTYWRFLGPEGITVRYRVSPPNVSCSTWGL